MRVLITGASGFLGSWFLDHFIRTGVADIWSVDIAPHPTSIPIDHVDLEEWLADFDQQVDIALHFAAPVGGRMKIELDPMYNADAFRLDSVFFRWAVKHAKLAVYPSSSAVYPVGLQHSARSPMLREHLVQPWVNAWHRPDELYGVSKLAGECMALQAADRYGLNVLAVRPFSGYGPGQSLDYPVPSILQRVAEHQDPLTVWGPGTQVRDFVYVTDIVEATMARIAAGVQGYQTMNIASGVGTSFNEIANLAAEIEGYHTTIVNDVARPAGVFRRIGDPTVMEQFYKLKVPLSQGLMWTLDRAKTAVRA